jgi:hypothetical protein
VLDDHSRFCVVLAACPNQQGPTVQQHLSPAFRASGLPERILVDDGPPWGSGADHPWTPLTVWLLRLGVLASHGRPYHPQTRGKEERLHRTLDVELLERQTFADLATCQRALDTWRQHYNGYRPHEALGGQPPASRFTASAQIFPEVLPPLECGAGVLVRKVQLDGTISLGHRLCLVGRAFHRLVVGLCPTAQDGVWEVQLGRFTVGIVDQRLPA